MKTQVYETAMVLVVLAALFIITSMFYKYWLVQKGQQIFFCKCFIYYIPAS